jgi:hypothetical protein
MLIGPANHNPPAMRAALSLLALVIVAAIVLSLVKKQAATLKPPAAGASAAGAALPQPKAVGEQVQTSIDDAAKRAVDAASAATN